MIQLVEKNMKVVNHQLFESCGDDMAIPIKNWLALFPLATLERKHLFLPILFGVRLQKNIFSLSVCHSSLHLLSIFLGESEVFSCFFYDKLFISVFFPALFFYNNNIFPVFVISTTAGVSKLTISSTSRFYPSSLMEIHI